MPGLTVFFEAGHASPAHGENFHRADVAKNLDRDHVPDIVRDDVANDEVNVERRINSGGDVAAGVKGVSVDGAGMSGLDLHAPKIAAGFEDEIVAVAFAPGLGNAESEGGGFVKEGGFGDLAAALGWELRFDG